MSSFETTVIYRNIPDFPGYKVGNDGTVWSCLERVYRNGKRVNNQPGTNWKKLKENLPKAAYYTVGLAKDKKQFTKAIHRLVLENFVGPCPEGMEACHNDGNSLNNNLSNLRWDTHNSNIKDSIKHDAYSKGEDHYRSKLTLNQVIAIREEYSLGKASYTQLASRYLVKHKAIWDVVNRKTWKHL